MIAKEDVTFENAMEQFPKLLDAIPKGKRGLMLYQMSVVECTLREQASLLDALRGYFLQTTGEESPFVKKIDALMKRREKAAKKAERPTVALDTGRPLIPEGAAHHSGGNADALPGERRRQVQGHHPGDGEP